VRLRTPEKTLVLHIRLQNYSLMMYFFILKWWLFFKLHQ